MLIYEGHTALLKMEMPKRLNVELMLKILEKLQKRDKIKRTPLARKCGMAYNGLMKYLIFLEALKLTVQTEDKDGIFVSITKSGIEVQSTLTIVKN